jgi:hypothetical protein
MTCITYVTIRVPIPPGVWMCASSVCPVVTGHTSISRCSFYFL